MDFKETMNVNIQTLGLCHESLTMPYNYFLIIDLKGIFKSYRVFLEFRKNRSCISIFVVQRQICYSKSEAFPP